MIRGIRYQDGMDIRQLEDAGFELVEYAYDRESGGMEDAKLNASSVEIPQTETVRPVALKSSGISISFKDVAKGELSQALFRASDLGASYLVIETEDEVECENMLRVLEEHIERIKASGLRIFIENGYCTSCQRFIEHAFSNPAIMADIVDHLNQMAESDCFGICLNTGHGNLLGKNICGMIEYLGHRIGLLHACDNDGRLEQRQMPYTFTRGRGELSTDWYGIIGALTRIGFRGPLVCDIAGLFDVSPPSLRLAWYGLLSSVMREWEMILELESYLKEARESGPLILFGAGKMFINYIEVWGDAYPPSFIVDNNRKLWGLERRNIPIQPPDILLENREHPPHILLCNMYYESIERQLKSMGLTWHRYDDKYFFRYQNIMKERRVHIC